MTSSNPNILFRPDELLVMAQDVVKKMPTGLRDRLSRIDVLLITEAAMIDPLLFSLICPIFEQLRVCQALRVILDVDFHQLRPSSVSLLFQIPPL